MYNGVGLSTARGSGTSGYVQKSLAYAKQKRSEKFDYGEQLKKLRENPLPPPKPANREILEHEEKRRQANLMFMAENKIKPQHGTKSSVVARRVDEHLAKVEKEKAIDRMAEAFKINKSEFQHGAAFDLETQEIKRLQRIAEHQERKREEKLKRKEKEKEEKELEEQRKELFKEKDDNNEDVEEGEEKKVARKEKKEKKDRKEKKDKKEKKSKKSKKRKRSNSSHSSKSN